MMETELKVENVEQLIKLLNGIMPNLRKKATFDGLKAGQKVINQQAKQNLYATKKGQSKTGYSYYGRVFRIANLRSRTVDEFRVKAGVQNYINGYKLRWIEWGTNERSYFKKKKQHRTGKMEGTNFFFNAVQQKRDEAQKKASEAIIESLKKIIQ